MSKLSQIKKGASVEIQKLSPLLEQRVQQRLRELGFSEGETLVCLRRTPLGGPIVLQTAGSVFSLGIDVTDFIEVRLLEGGTYGS